MSSAVAASQIVIRDQIGDHLMVRTIKGQFYSASYDARPLIEALKSSVAQGER